MKNIQGKIKLQVLALAVLLISVFNTLGQESKEVSRYVSDLYKVAFQIPKDSAKRTESTETRVIFAGEKSKFGVTARLEFTVDEQKGLEAISQLLETDDGIEALANSVIQQLKSKTGNSELTVLEKKRIQIAGLNAFKLVTAAVLSNTKIRSAMFVVPVPKQERMYSFIVISSDDSFDKWFPNAEIAVNSFELLNASK